MTGLGNKGIALDIKTMLVISLAFVVVAAFMYMGFFMGQASAPETETTGNATEEITVYRISRGDFEVDAKSAYSGGQDSEDDWDIDIFELDETNDRSINDLYNDKVLDCRNAAVHTIDPNKGFTSIELDSDDVKYSSGMVCLPNLNRIMQDTTAADTEGLIDNSDGVVVVGTDINDTGSTANDEVTLTAGKLYLITIIDEDENDFYFTALLFRMPTHSVIEAEDIIATGGQNLRLDIKMYARAVSKTELDVEGRCTDDQDHSDYAANDLGVLSDQLTTNTSDVNIECNFDIELQDDGVALILSNPFTGGSASDEGSIQVDPYTQNDTGDTAHDLGADGDDYGTGSDAAGGDFIYTLYVQGNEIVSDSTQDAYTDNAGENMRESEVASGLFKNVYDKGSKVTLNVEVNDIYAADVDATDNGSDETLSDGELIADIEIYEPCSATDIFNSIEGNNPELIG